MTLCMYLYLINKVKYFDLKVTYSLSDTVSRSAAYLTRIHRMGLFHRMSRTQPMEVSSKNIMKDLEASENNG